MKVLFASGDIGGARALLPVIALCARNSLPFAVLEHGHIITELPERWQRVSLNGEQDWTAVESFYKRNDIGLLVFASSVKDSTVLTLARRAKELNILVIHVLDGWTSYRRRMEMDGLPAFVPDVYAVMDDLALQGAVKDGIDESVLKITGQPALASLSNEYASWQKMDTLKERERLGFDSNKTMITFVSEPVKQDQGASSASPQYRGYTEKIVLRLFCDVLQPYADEIEIGLLPHPRENVEELLNFWNACRGSLKGGLVYVNKGRESLFLADGVAGMASLLLYEAWLLGKPVISLQPGLKLAPLRMLERRNGVVFVDSREAISASVATWVSNIRPGMWSIPRPELQIHETAPDKILTLVEKCLKQARLCKAINSQRTMS